MKKNTFAIIGLTILLGSCSSSSTPEFSSLIYPAGLAVSSILQNPEKTQNITPTNFNSTRNYLSKKNAYTLIASADGSCAVTFPSLTPALQSPSCYGPELFYKNHPDGDDDNPAAILEDELGIWTENNNEEACMASKANQEIVNISQKVDAAMLLIASMACSIESDEALNYPEVGSSLDLSSQLTSNLTNTELTIQTAKLTRKANASDGFQVFEYEIAFEDEGTGEYKIFMQHHPTLLSGLSYQGKMWVSYEGIPTPEFSSNTVNSSFAFSLSYERIKEDLRYYLVATPYNLFFVFDAGNPDMFNANKRIDPSRCSNNNCWRNFSQNVTNLNTKTGLGSATHAWQSRVIDGVGSTRLARIFNMYTEKQDNDILGYAFFGFGEGFNRTTGSMGNNTIDRYICNWNGPEADRTGVSNRAQKQTLSLGATSEVFEVVSSNITHAPTNSCNYEGGLDFRFSTDEDVDLDDPDNDAPAITNDLVSFTDEDLESFPIPLIPEQDF